ncbi:phage tail protein [Enterobacter hormaechei]|uniref:phage tail protein n=1 Tax=Enterobacter hormaechei TaxID=158836 RepID=UPI001BCFA255
MFAVLGDIEFELITYWDGFEATFGVDYAEHPRIEGKPGLQFVGDKLDEIQISLVFHQHYCVPDVELARLRTAMKAHQALALVFGNGDYRGWFVITDVTATSEQTDSTGNVLAVNATASLREYIGDPKNPLQPPAIRTTVPGVGAVSGAVPSPSGVAQYVRDGVNYAKQAQSVLQTTISAVRVAQKMKDNPAVALTRVPGLMSGLGNVSGALGQSVPAFNALTESMPDAISLARATSDAATYVQQAQSSLRGVDGSNIAAALDAVSGQLNSASTTFTRMSPGLSTMAARILARSV